MEESKMGSEEITAGRSWCTDAEDVAVKPAGKKLEK